MAGHYHIHATARVAGASLDFSPTVGRGNRKGERFTDPQHVLPPVTILVKTSSRMFEKSWHPVSTNFVLQSRAATATWFWDTRLLVLV